MISIEIEPQTEPRPRMSLTNRPSAMSIAAHVKRGKSHMCALLSDALMDTEGKFMEDVGWKLTQPPLVHVPEDWDDLFKVIQTWCRDPAINTIGIDTIRILEILAYEDVFPNGKKMYSPDVGAARYALVNNRIRDVIKLVRQVSKKNLLLMAHYKPEYDGEKATGNQIAEAPKCIPKDCNYILHMVDGVMWSSPSGKPSDPSVFVFKVEANGSVAPWERAPQVAIRIPKDRTGPTNLYNDLVSQLCVPYNDTYEDRLVAQFTSGGI